jgi:pimeloyl-ACP methyl ester carboxylesterase
LLWAERSPTWSAAVREAALSAVAASFDGDDWVRVALSAYRATAVPSETDPADDALRARLQAPTPARCETRIVHGADDGVERSPLSAEALARWFPCGVEVTTLVGVGHRPRREAPDAVAAAVLA